MGTTYDIPLPLVVLTGEPGSGKSVFSVFSTPNGLDLTKPPQAVVFDFEDSVGPYVGALNFVRYDVRQMMADGIQNQVRQSAPSDEHWKKVLLEKADVSASPSASLFRGSIMSLLAIKPGQFLTCSLDTLKPLQEGATDWLLLHPEAFGKTLAQYQKMKAAILIPDVRKILDHILLVECRSRFEMTVVTYHQKNEWEGQGESAHKTGQRISEAWELADRLSTLYATLDRRPKAKGKSAPRVPSGLVTWPYGKSRLLRVRDGVPVPVLPPRLPEFTPEAIRAYMASPPDYDNLKPGERMPDDTLTDDQKLLVAARVSDNERATSENKLSALELARAAAARPQQTAQQMTVSLGPVAATIQPPAQAQQPVPVYATSGQQSEMMGLLRKLFATGAEAQVWMQEKCGTTNLATITNSEADGVLAKLHKMIAAKTMPPEPSPATDPEPGADGKVTQGQRDQIRDMTMKLYGDQAKPEQARWLGTMGFSETVSLSYAQAEGRILELQRLANPVAEGDLPF